MGELQSTLSLSAVALVLEGVAARQPPAADEFTVFALNARIGLLVDKTQEL